MVPRALVVCLLSALCVFAPADVPAQTKSGALDADIQELKKGQAEIKKELEEIRKLLTPPPPAPTVEKLAAAVAVGTNVVRGRNDAPVTMIEFSDYQCPFCKRHTDQTVPGLVKDYVDAGKVRYAFRDFPLTQIHPVAAKAAEAARCAGEQGKYWEMHDQLFAKQKELQAEKLPAHAQAIGLDATKFRECLDQNRYAAAVEKDLDTGTELGVGGTPAIVIGVTDGENAKSAVIIRGSQPIATFKAEIDKLLAPPVTAKQ